VDADVVIVSLDVGVVINAEGGMDSGHATGEVNDEWTNQVEDESL
jgi:hypothetical protein